MAKVTVEGWTVVRRLELEGLPADVHEIMSKLGLEPNASTTCVVKEKAQPKSQPRSQPRPKPQSRPQLSEEEDVPGDESEDASIDELRACKRLKDMCILLRGKGWADDVISEHLLAHQADVPLLARVSGLPERITTAFELIDATAA